MLTWKRLLLDLVSQHSLPQCAQESHTCNTNEASVDWQER